LTTASPYLQYTSDVQSREP